MFRAAAGKNLARSLFERQSVPASEYFIHALAPQRQAFQETRRRDCLLRRSDIERWNEYRRWAEFPSTRFFLRPRPTPARLFFRRACAPFPSSAKERAQRSPSRGVYPEWRRRPFGQERRGKPWKSLARCGLQPCAHAKCIRRIGAGAKLLESIRHRPEVTAYSRCESFDKAHDARRAPKSASVRRRKPAKREGNRRQAKRLRYCLPVFRDSDWQFRRSRKQPRPTTEIPAIQFHAAAARYTCTRRRCGLHQGKFQFGGAREYSRCRSNSGWVAFQRSTK